MVEVDPTVQLIGPHGPVTLLEVFEGRRLLLGVAPGHIGLVTELGPPTDGAFGKTLEASLTRGTAS